MSVNPRQFVIAAACVCVVLSLRRLDAQTCAELFSELSAVHTMQCANARFDLDISGSGVTSQAGLASGLLQADFDGLGLFDVSGSPEADYLVSPFLGQVDVTVDGPLDAAVSFTVEQHGQVSFAPRDVAFQQGTFGSMSRVAFVPFSDASDGPFELNVKFTQTFLLTDPVNNDTRGAAIGGSNAELSSGGENRLEFFGFAELDTARDGDAVQLFLDYDEHAGTMRIGQSSAIVMALFDEAVIVMEGEKLTLDSHAFGSIFSEGFEAGDTSAWSSNSPNRFTVSVTSPDPNVRFRLVPEPSSVVLVFLAAIAGIGFWVRSDPNKPNRNRVCKV